jgi:hypothetical protein
MRSIPTAQELELFQVKAVHRLRPDGHRLGWTSRGCSRDRMPMDPAADCWVQRGANPSPEMATVAWPRNTGQALHGGSKAHRLHLHRC